MVLRPIRSVPTNIGVYASWLDSLPDKQEVLGSSPRAPTNGYHLPPLNGRVIEKVTTKVRQALSTFDIGV